MLSKHDYVSLQGGKKMKSKFPLKYSIKREPTKMQTYTEKLSEPWFTLISLGLKTVEGRKNKGIFKAMNVGDLIEWVNYDFGPRNIKTRVVRKAVYKTFEEYLTSEGLQKCLPGMPSIEHGLKVYFKYFTKEQEAEFGVVAIELKLV